MTKNRLYWIDWLKGVACFCVMAGHSRAIANELSASSEWILNELLKPLFNGGLMVCLFAVLSGYLSSLSICKTKSLFKTLIKTLETVYKKNQDILTSYTLYADLADYTSGKNPQRLSFERYVLSLQISRTK